MKKLIILVALALSACDPTETPDPSCSNTCVNWALPGTVAYHWCGKLDRCGQMQGTYEDCVNGAVNLFAGAACCNHEITQPCLNQLKYGACNEKPTSCLYLCNGPEDFGVVPVCE